MPETSEFKNDKSYLMEVCKGLEELRVSNKHDVRQSQTEAFTGVNRSTSELNKLFFTISSLLIPTIYTLVSLNETRTALSAGKQSGFLVISLASLLVSLIFGTIHVVVDINFYKKWLRSETRKSRIWSSTSFWPGVPTPEQIKTYFDDYETKSKEITTITEQTPTETPETWLLLQGVFMISGLILLSIVAIMLLPT